MGDLNKVQIIGRLGQDPDTRYTASGAAVVNMSVATSERWRDKQSGEQKERTEWHRAVIFGRRAEVASEYLRKGSLVYVEGKLQTSKWQGDDGNDRYTTEIIVDRFDMLGGRSDGAQAAPKSEGFRDKPAEAVGIAEKSGATLVSAPTPKEDNFKEDDIPF